MTKLAFQDIIPSLNTKESNLARANSATDNGVVFNAFLALLALCTLFLIVILKSETALQLGGDSLLFYYTIFVTTFQLSRLVGAMFYKQSVSLIPSDKFYEPTVSFVIPCKNEEVSISKTIEKCFSADYPSKKLEVIVINDGSTDGTIDVLRKIQKRYPRLDIIDWTVNKGKRHAMAAGFRRAYGEIIVQLDSDSYIEPRTFREIIAPFADRKIGAVCAHADPENASKNMLTKMQAAYYFLSFRILKAAESSFFTVFCCSGCSSAYRRSIVLPILSQWLKESFLGLPVTWGDDRALTNWVLKRGYKTIYTDRAQAYTICPDTFKVFLKQQVRWKKGWFVNSIFASRFIWKQNPFVAFTYFFPLIFVTLVTPFMAVRAFIYNPFFEGILPIYYFIGILLVAVLVTIYYRAVTNKNHYWPYVFVWSGINMIFLSFILFYALATIQNRRWGTR